MTIQQPPVPSPLHPCPDGSQRLQPSSPHHRSPMAGIPWDGAAVAGSRSLKPGLGYSLAPWRAVLRQTSGVSRHRNTQLLLRRSPLDSNGLSLLMLVRINESEQKAHTEKPRITWVAAADTMGRMCFFDFACQKLLKTWDHFCVIDCLHPVVVMLVQCPSRVAPLVALLRRSISLCPASKLSPSNAPLRTQK